MMRITITCENEGNAAFEGMGHEELAHWLLVQAAATDHGAITALRDDNGNTVGYVRIQRVDNPYEYPESCPECGSDSVHLLGSMEWANKLDGWVHMDDEGDYFCRDCEHSWNA